MNMNHLEEVSSPREIIDAAYRLISGRTGEARDWDRWRKLHAPGARLIPIERNHDGASFANVMSAEEFIASRSRFFAQQSFFEWETAREERQFGALTQVWSSYEAAEEPGGPTIRRGVNSFQLWNDGTRWWIVSVAWDAIAALDVK
jgi:hypothetical protein